MSIPLKPFFKISIVAIGFIFSNISAQDNTLYSGFVNPPISAKPRALWTWVDGNFDKESITYELEEAKAKGMGGFDIWDVHHVQDERKIVPQGKPFMGDEYTDAIVHTINEATRLNLEIGLIVASGWNAGGAWTKPQHATMGMYRTELLIDGPTNKKYNLPFPNLPDKAGKGQHLSKAIIERDADGKPMFYKDISIIAFPLTNDSTISDVSKIIDITNQMDKEGNVQLNLPKGKWKIVRMVCANTGQPMIAHTPSSNGPMIDHFNPEATEIHINYFIDKLLAKLGTFNGKALKYLYSDSYEVTGELWTPLMIEEFEKQFGYSMKPFLPVFQGFTVINKEATQRFLYDYRQLLSDLIIKSHYKKAKEICEKNGIGYVAEAAGPGKPLHNCPFESLKSSGVLTHPRGEFWHKSKGTNNENLTDILQVIKGVSCASHIYNQKIVDAEAFTSTWLWQESLDELKPTADKAFCEGLNRIVFHTFPHVPKSAGKPGYIYGFGTQIGVTQPWWPMSKPFMDYLGRCGYMLQQGNFFADVLYYYGDEAPNFVPNKKIDPSLGFGYDYDVVNSDVILNKLQIKDGKYTLPHGPQYQVLVLPNIQEMNLKVLQQIEKFVLEGGIIIGPKPIKSTGYKDYQINDKKVKELSEKIWGNIDGKSITENAYGKGKVIFGKSIKEVLNNNKIFQDVNIGSDISIDSVDFIHRKSENEDIYYFTSKYKKPINTQVSFRVIGKKVQLWDPVSGKNYNTNFNEENGYTKVDLKLIPNGSYFVVFSNNTLPANGVQLSNNPKYESNKNISVTGNWKVSFPEGLSAPKTITLSGLNDLSKNEIDGVKYFSGIATYETTFEIPTDINFMNQKVYLDLGTVAVVADVTLNNQKLGVRWNSPFVLEAGNALKSGKNSIKIEVANRWPHRLIGDSKLPENQRITNTNITKLPNGWMYPFDKIPNEKYGLLPSGLIGPVSLYFVKN
ncbi:MAG: glycosyl hydrolase [Bacteroidota bacterium]|nr:glycosyl hydrolase [Bacteroidota bacterium]